MTNTPEYGPRSNLNEADLQMLEHITGVGVRMQQMKVTSDRLKSWGEELQKHFEGIAPATINPSSEWTFEERSQLLANIAPVLKAASPDDPEKLKRLSDAIIWLTHYPQSHLEQHREEILLVSQL